MAMRAACHGADEKGRLARARSFPRGAGRRTLPRAVMATAPVIPPNLPQIGEVLDGKYLIEEVLGAGGVGIVVAAKHVVLGHRVAIKFLLHPAAQAPEDAERLLREARAISAIKSEHVARVLDVDRLPNGAPYMVMEYLAGTNLGR